MSEEILPEGTPIEETPVEVPTLEEPVEVKKTAFTKKVVPYFSAKDTVDFSKRFKGSVVGMNSAMWMLAKFFVPSLDDAEFESYLNATSAFKAPEESDEYFLAYDSGAYEWVIQSKCITELLKSKGIPIVQPKYWVELPSNIGFGHWGVLEYVLRYGPVVVKVKGLGGVEGESAILALYVDTDGQVVYHDPRGDALSNYVVGSSGAYVKYPKEYLTPYVCGGAIPMLLVACEPL